VLCKAYKKWELTRSLVPRQVPDRVSIFRGRLFPQSRPHLVCGANGTALHFRWLGQIPDSPTTTRSLLADRGFSKVRNFETPTRAGTTFGPAFVCLSKAGLADEYNAERSGNRWISE